MALRVVARVLLTAGLAVSTVFTGRRIASQAGDVVITWPAWTLRIGLFAALITRTFYVMVRNGRAAMAGTRRRMSVVSYREFALWALAMLVISTAFAIDETPSQLGNERKRAENAQRLMRFYGRVPPLPSPFIAATPERERT
jgi:hypothetical protein